MCAARCSPSSPSTRNEQAYNDVIVRLEWPNTQPSTFEDCCQRVHEFV